MMTSPYPPDNELELISPISTTIIGNNNDSFDTAKMTANNFVKIFHFHGFAVELKEVTSEAVKQEEATVSNSVAHAQKLLQANNATFVNSVINISSLEDKVKLASISKDQ